MSDEELLTVYGGAFSAALLSGIVSAIKTIYEIGKSIGTSIRRVIEKKYCKIN